MGEEEVRISPRTGKPIDKKKASNKNGRSKKSRSKDVEKATRKKMGLEEDGVRISRRTGKPVNTNMSHNGKNSPVIGMNGYNLEPGDNRRIIAVNLQLLNMPDIDIHDVDAVAERLSSFFGIYAEADMKPTVAGMAVALNGHNRQWLLNLINDRATGGGGYKADVPREVANLIKKAYAMMETSWESYMNGGKLNPVTGIFLGKNNFHYQDKTEYVLTPNQKAPEEYSVDEIKARYLPPQEDKAIPLDLNKKEGGDS